MRDFAAASKEVQVLAELAAVLADEDEEGDAPRTVGDATPPAWEPHRLLLACVTVKCLQLRNLMCTMRSQHAVLSARRLLHAGCALHATRDHGIMCIAWATRR